MEKDDVVKITGPDRSGVQTRMVGKLGSVLLIHPEGDLLIRLETGDQMYFPVSSCEMHRPKNTNRHFIRTLSEEILARSQSEEECNTSDDARELAGRILREFDNEVKPEAREHERAQGAARAFGRKLGMQVEIQTTTPDSVAFTLVSPTGIPIMSIRLGKYNGAPWSVGGVAPNDEIWKVTP